MTKKVKKVENVPAYAENYVKKYFDLQEQGKFPKSLGKPIFYPLMSIPVIIVGLIYGLLVQVDFMSFGILGAVSMALLFLELSSFYSISTGKEGVTDCLSGDVSAWWGRGEIAWALLTAFGKNVCDQTTVEYFKSVMREKGKKQRRAMWLSLLAPLSAFAAGMISIACGMGIVAKIVYPVGFFTAMVLIFKFSSDLDIKVNGIMKIRAHACPKCHIVDEYDETKTHDRDYRFKEVIKSKVGERTIGTVYDKDGKAIGSVSKTYVTNTYQRGTRHEYTLRYRCTHCGREFVNYTHEDTDVEEYTV